MAHIALDALTAPYCALLAEVTDEVQVTWSGASVVVDTTRAPGCEASLSR